MKMPSRQLGLELGSARLRKFRRTAAMCWHYAMSAKSVHKHRSWQHVLSATGMPATLATLSNV